jgi:hypothetical protein
MATNVFQFIRMSKKMINSRENKFPQGNERALTRLFGLAYCLDLYVYIGYKAVFPLFKSNDIVFFDIPNKDIITRCELAGMIFLLFIFLITLFVKNINFTLSARKLFWAGLGTQLLLAFATPWFADNLILLCIFRFLVAIIVSFNLCTYLTIIGRSIGRKKRTYTMTLVFAIGFLGPFLANLIKIWHCNNFVYLILPSFISLFAIYILTSYNKYALFEGKNNKIEINKNIQSILLKRNFWQSLLSLFLCGLMVQFSVRYLLEHSEKFVFDKFENVLDESNFKNMVYLTRYLGSSLGVLFFGYWSVEFSKTYLKISIFQIRLGERKIVYQLAILCGFFALYGFSKLDANYHNIYWRYGTPFLLGICNAMWCIIFIQALETFGKKTQPIFVFLLPILLRGFWDLLTYDNLSVFVLGSSDSEQIKSSISILNNIVLLLGGIILLIGGITSILWHNNHEGGNRLDDYDDNFTKNFATAIVNDDLRREIASIDEKIVSAERMDIYIEKVSEIVKERLETVFDTSLYYYSFTFLNEEKEAFASKVKVNEAALKDLKKVKKDSIRNLFKYIRLILKSKAHKGLASYSFEKKHEGLVLAGDAKFMMPQTKENYTKAGYKIFDLSLIPMPEEKLIKEFWQNLSLMKDEYFKDNEKIDNLRAKFRTINVPLQDLHKYNTEQQIEPFNETNFPNEIRRLLTIRALGAWCYPKDEYFIYVITPQAGENGVKHNLNTSILLATANLIPVEKLNEIRQLLDSIMYQRALVLSKDAEAKNTIIQLSHSLKTALGYLQNKVSTFGEVRNDITEFEQRKNDTSQIISTIANTIIFNSKINRVRDIFGEITYSFLVYF